MPFRVGEIVELVEDLWTDNIWDERWGQVGFRGERATVFEVEDHKGWEFYKSYRISFEEQSGFIYFAYEDQLRSTNQMSILTKMEMEDIHKRFHDGGCRSLIPPKFIVGQIVTIKPVDNEDYHIESHYYGKRAVVAAINEPPRKRLDSQTYIIYIENANHEYYASEKQLEGTELYFPKSVIEKRFSDRQCVFSPGYIEPPLLTFPKIPKQTRLYRILTSKYE